MMKAIEGGMMMAMEPPDAMSADAKGFAYPRAAMAGIRMVPSAAVSAGPEPEIPAKKTQQTMATKASPPWTGPMSRLASRTSRSEMPTRSRMSPAMMKKGMARSWNLARLE